MLLATNSYVRETFNFKKVDTFESFVGVSRSSDYILGTASLKEEGGGVCVCVRGGGGGLFKGVVAIYHATVLFITLLFPLIKCTAA